MKKVFVFLFLSLGLNAQSILPQPVILETRSQDFEINSQTGLYYDKNVKDLEPIAKELYARLTQNAKPIIQTHFKNNQIALVSDYSLPQEGYSLQINAQGITLKASTAVGFFYGIESLLQWKGESSKLKGVYVKDYPRFGYRGVMLDVCRHFYSVDFIKKMIDIWASYKINTFHWHLTDDQGWRIEIKQYPKLTQVGSVRKETAVGHYAENRYDGKPYGGFYTQEQIKEVVAYAASKHITVIPEIEMPGHAKAALAAYPELGCSGGPYEVRTTWGVEDDIFCPTEETFTFLQNVLTEVMALFPSKYIHIGGDEAPKVTWEKSKYAQDLMKREGLKDEHELQSYFIKRMDQFVTSKGRKIIGWDEILEGGLSPNATVMSWRGEEGGIAAAKQGHDVIMVPNSHFYLDYYQGAPTAEPLAIGGYLPLERVYSYEPLNKQLNPQQQKHILGIQANLWTEYITSEKQVEYMYFPRLLAVAELAWSENKMAYENFISRLEDQLKTLDKKGIQYSNSFRNISFTTNKKTHPVVELSSMGHGIIRYTLDGSEPNAFSPKYEKPIEVLKSSQITAALFNEKGDMKSKATSKSFVISKSTGLKYHLAEESDKQTEKGKYILTDGEKGDADSQTLWSGFWGKDFEIRMDFEKVISMSEVSMSFLGDYTSWILTPKEVEVFISNDGQRYTSVQKIELGTMENLSKHAINVVAKFKTLNARYLKVVAKNQGGLPASHPSAGQPSWIFVDEIGVN